MSNAAFGANALVFLGLLIAYVVLTALHDDGTALLGLMAGQAGSVGLSKGTDALANGKP